MKFRHAEQIGDASHYTSRIRIKIGSGEVTRGAVGGVRVNAREQALERRLRIH